MLENSIMESCGLNGNRQCGQLCSLGTLEDPIRNSSMSYYIILWAKLNLIDTMNFVSGVKNLSSGNPKTLLYKGFNILTILDNGQLSHGGFY